MTKHVWKTHKAKDKVKKKTKDNAFDNVLVNIFNKKQSRNLLILIRQMNA